jgi:acyl-CoA thioester hydrolase
VQLSESIIRQYLAPVKNNIKGNPMIEHEYSFRVAYSETDQMGTVHHSNYVKYYETARWELFRSMGISYSSIETAGYLLPVISMNFKFLRKTIYDAKLTSKTTLKDIQGARIWFTYKLYNEQNELINVAETELAFVGREDWKPCIVPDFVMKAIEANLNNKGLSHARYHL